MIVLDWHLSILKPVDTWLDVFQLIFMGSASSLDRCLGIIRYWLYPITAVKPESVKVVTLPKAHILLYVWMELFKVLFQFQWDTQLIPQVLFWQRQKISQCWTLTKIQNWKIQMMVMTNKVNYLHELMNILTRTPVNRMLRMVQIGYLRNGASIQRLRICLLPSSSLKANPSSVYKALLSAPAFHGKGWEVDFPRNLKQCGLRNVHVLPHSRTPRGVGIYVGMLVYTKNVEALGTFYISIHLLTENYHDCWELLAAAQAWLPPQCITPLTQPSCLDPKLQSHPNIHCSDRGPQQWILSWACKNFDNLPEIFQDILEEITEGYD